MMKKIFFFALFIACATLVNAVPAKRGWQTRTQADGTTIKVQQFGDEYYHYMINENGKEVREINGQYVEVGDEPTLEASKARRAQAQARRARANTRRAGSTFGVSPNLAEKGLVLLVNFTDSKMKTDNNQAKFDNLLNAENCTANNGYPSAAKYFSDQSFGQFNPRFDVYGPVTLDNNVAYYGGYDDEYAVDAVIEACRALDSSIDFSQYDNDNDGKVDVIFVLYAGKGEADGGSESTIWPHNYNIQEWISGGYATKYTKDQTKLDGVYLDNYVVAPELDGNGKLEGIGTVCHEFGHALGLPDYYETNYGKNYRKGCTPNEWDVMEAGSYNASGHCPPNYSPWERYFFGWLTPENLGSKGQLLELKANGTDGYKAYQINSSGKQQTATTSGKCYYIENRQNSGWDAPLGGHGMLIWQVNYNQTAWQNNAPNNDETTGSPLYTVYSAYQDPTYGNQVGYVYDEWEYDNYYQDWKPVQSSGKDCSPYNTFPGTKKITSWDVVSGKPLLNIKETNGVITCTYIEVPSDPTKYTVTWMVNGEVLETKDYALDGSENLVLPTKTVTPCEGTTFIGWTAESAWCDPFNDPADLFTTANGKVTKDVTYNAVFK